MRALLSWTNTTSAADVDATTSVPIAEINVEMVADDDDDVADDNVDDDSGDAADSTAATTASPVVETVSDKTAPVTLGDDAVDMFCSVDDDNSICGCADDEPGSLLRPTTRSLRSLRLILRNNWSGTNVLVAKHPFGRLKEIQSMMLVCLSGQTPVPPFAIVPAPDKEQEYLE